MIAKAQGLEYEVHGAGEPVLLIHGSHVADAFVPLLQEGALAERYQLIRYRRRGFAGSDPVSSPFTIAEQARDAVKLLGHLGVSRAHVVGHSYGAVTALQVAADSPEVVHSLVLLEPPLMTPAEAGPVNEQFAPLFEAYSSGDAAGAVDLFMQFVGGPDWRSVVAKSVLGGPEQAEADAATFFEVELPALAEWDFTSIPSGSLSQPALYVIGSESGEPFESAIGHARSLAPGLEETRLPGLDHLLQMRDPALVAEAIASFIARHPL